jgi:hypothetical protein
MKDVCVDYGIKCDLYSEPQYLPIVQVCIHTKTKADMEFLWNEFVEHFNKLILEQKTPKQ